MPLQPSRPLAFLPGQWVDFFIPHVAAMGGFSFVSTPRQLERCGTFELAVKRSSHPAAAWLHENGPRAEESFVDLNCAGLTPQFLETELFGHEKGAFTGAVASKLGLFELAHRGSLFLDEIGDVDPAVQPKLLKVLEEKRFRRLGDVRDRTVDVRLIAATNRDLPGDVAAGRFRSDLYYRLNVAEITLPPLRERREDIPYLTASFVRGFAQRFAKPLVGLTSAAERRLADAPWEGNIRQLRNVLERACILAEGEFVDETELSDIMLQHSLPVTRSAAAQGAAAVAPAARTAPLVEIEREHIVRTLEQVRGNKAVAARLLGISRRAFYRQLERHGLHTSVPAVKPASAAPIVPLGRVS